MGLRKAKLAVLRNEQQLAQTEVAPRLVELRPKPLTTEPAMQWHRVVMLLMVVMTTTTAMAIVSMMLMISPSSP